MFHITEKIILALVLMFSFAVSGAERTWSDPTTNRGYVLLSGTMPYWKAHAECSKKGMALSDLRFLTDDERKNFLATDSLISLNWEEGKTSNDVAYRTAQIWQSSEIKVVAVNMGAGAATILKLLNKGGKQFTDLISRDANDENAHAVCMAVPGFWYRCSMEIKCVYQNGASNYAIRHLMADFGATRNEATQRIVTRSQEPTWSVSEGKCGLTTETTRCYETLFISN